MCFASLRPLFLHRYFEAVRDLPVMAVPVTLAFSQPELSKISFFG